MSTLYRRPASYYLSWLCAPGCPKHPAGGRQHCVSLRTTNQEVAEHLQRDKDRQIQEDKARAVLGLITVHRPAQPWSLKEFMDRYEQKVLSERIVAPSTWDRAERWALQSLLRFRPEATLADLNADWIQAYERAVKFTVSPHTWNSRRATLKAIGNRAVAWTWLTENPFLHLTRAKGKKKRPKRLLQEQIPIVLKAIPNRFWQLVTLFLYATGVRRQELCNLERSHIRWEQGFLEIETNKENEPKVVALTDSLRWVLREAMQYAPTSKYVFSRDGQPLHPDAVKNYYRWVSRKVGFPVSTHRFRHSHGTHRMEAGDNLKAVADTLGHADIRTTAGFYLDLDLPAQRAALDRLPVEPLLKLVAKSMKSVARPRKIAKS